MKIKSPSVAGTFYPADKEELEKHLNYFEQNNATDYTCTTRAVIVPHAGYMYSAQLASAGFQYIDKNVKNVFIIAPPHHMPVKDIALSNFDKWSTPLGEIEINQSINSELVEKFDCHFNDEAFSREHSVEVQVPFIQKYLSNAKIIPILANNKEKVAEIIEYYWDNTENAFVISSDLSHFSSSKDAKKIDVITAKLIESNDIEEFSSERACGAVGICGLISFAKKKNYSLVRVGMYNSGDITGDESRVVGYGSWLLYEGTKNNFIKKYFSEFALNVCRDSIIAKLGNTDLKIDKIPAVFLEAGASFVTLEKNNDLRGCIGSIIAHRLLVDDLAQNARNSAFSDPRFRPVEKDELEEISINISLLSAPEKMTFTDEQDLLSQIRPEIDGIIINDGGRQAVYLPSVWEQLPEKEIFLNSLKLKAGMSESHFSDTFEAFRFTTEYIKE